MAHECVTVYLIIMILLVTSSYYNNYYDVIYYYCYDIVHVEDRFGTLFLFCDAVIVGLNTNY